MDQGLIDYYALLRVPPGAAHAQIKAAWKTRARQTHPDVNPGNPRAAEEFRRLAEAWRVLGNPLQREMYDVARAGANARSGARGREDATAGRWQGQIRLLPWEAKLLGAVCGGFLALYRKLQRPLSNVWFWLVLAGVLVLGIWATWPAGAWLSAGMVLGVFFVQVVLVGYLYLRWLIGMLVARR
jgi:curved DNA-binding protein CbpA